MPDILEYPPFRGGADAIHPVCVITRNGKRTVEIAATDSENQAKVLVVPYSASITPNSDTTDILEIGPMTGPLTLNAPIGTPRDGKKLTIRLAQDSTGNRVVTYDPIYQPTDDVTAALDPTAANKKWHRLFIWQASASKWVMEAINRGTP